MDGSVDHFVPTRSGTYELRLSHTRLIRGYVAGDLHNFLGFIDSYSGITRSERLNGFVNVRDASVPPATVATLGSHAQMSDHVLNVRIDSLIPASFTLPPLAREAYRYLPDVFDFLAIVGQVRRTQNRDYSAVRNDIGGLGISMFSNTATYGSSGRLQGVIRYPIDTLYDLAERAASHEIGHRWLAFFQNSDLASGRPHWPASSLAQGVMGHSIGGAGGQGGTYARDFSPRADGRYDVRCTLRWPGMFTDMDLYAMGLVPADSVGTHYILADQSQTLLPACGSTVDARPITVADVIARNGQRTPTWQQSQREFRVGTVVISWNRLLDETEMAFFEHMAARGELRTEVRYTSGFASGMTKPFYLATGGRATLVTRVR